MKNFLTFALLVLPAAFAPARAADLPPLTVAVYDFKGEMSAKPYAPKITPLVTADLAAETNIVLLERAELGPALNEQAFGVSGLVSSDAAAKIGQITGAKVLVAGEVMMTGGDTHMVIVATIIGTETGRLFAAKVDGEAENFPELTAALSAKIAQTIGAHATNLIAVEKESTSARLDRVVKSIVGANRPSVSVEIRWSHPSKARAHLIPGHCTAAETEFGAILLRAGFPVVDEKSDRKPDIEITGVLDRSQGPGAGGLYSYRAVLELKVQQRLTGDIIAIDRQESIATDATKMNADRSSEIQAVDDLAQRILPLLAK
jgi:hypothetical protein